MDVFNATSIPDDVVRDIMRFVAPPGVRRVEVRLANARGRMLFNGRAYMRRDGDTTRMPRVLLCIARERHLPRPPTAGPRRAPRRGAYLPIPWLATPEETLVYLAAHELRHVWQARVKRGRRVWGARGQFSERDADAYAIRTLRAWRRAHPAMPRGSFAMLDAPRALSVAAAA